MAIIKSADDDLSLHAVRAGYFILIITIIVNAIFLSLGVWKAIELITGHNCHG